MLLKACRGTQSRGASSKDEDVDLREIFVQL